MFTTFDKAIAAIVGGLVSLFVMLGVAPESWHDPTTIGTISSFGAMILAWLVPNKSRHGDGGGP